MAKAIFYSWQSDTPNKVGRSFIKDVLEEVCADLATDASLDEALRDVEVDSDTQGIAGQPPIAETIFKKIDAASVFVADLTFTGTRMDGRPAPNPNVLIEYGWALKSLTYSRVICVMNTAYGEPNNDTLPFDLAHLRWPIRYTLFEESTPQERADEKRKLFNVLKEAIRLSIAAVPSPTPDPPPVFPAVVAKDGPARFRSKGEAIGFEDGLHYGESTKEIFLTPGPAMWLRLMPSTKPEGEWTPRQLKELSSPRSLLMPLIHPAGGYSYLRASDGEGMYRASDSQTEGSIINIAGVTFAFKTGEVWGIETALLNYSENRLYMTEVEQKFVEGILTYSQFLNELGINPPYHWKAGLTGVRGRQIGYAPRPGHNWIRDGGPPCATDLIEAEGEILPDQPATTALLPFFKKVFEECGIERPDYLPQ
ncbi:MAG: hypothetical protein WCK46_00680 [Candidatus Adlerbacteria bacterium]